MENARRYPYSKSGLTRHTLTGFPAYTTNWYDYVQFVSVPLLFVGLTELVTQNALVGGLQVTPPLRHLHWLPIELTSKLNLLQIHSTLIVHYVCTHL